MSVAEPQKPKSCFLITPIGADGSEQRVHADWVFEYLSPALTELGYDLVRSDRVNKPNQITVDIFQRVLESDLCIADLTFLNPNVMYELGVRHMVQKEAIQVCRTDWMGQLPFDTHNQRTIPFETSTPKSLRDFVADLVTTISDINEDEPVSNPLTHALGSIELKSTGDSRDKFIADLAERLESLERSPVAASTAAAIFGQGELATQNLPQVRRLWRLDQKASQIDWAELEDGSITGVYREFQIVLSPETNGRWRSSAKVAETGIDVPYPRWRHSLDDAKSAIVEAIDLRLEELEET